MALICSQFDLQVQQNLFRNCIIITASWFCQFYETLTQCWFNVSQQHLVYWRVLSTFITVHFFQFPLCFSKYPLLWYLVDAFLKTFRLFVGVTICTDVFLPRILSLPWLCFLCYFALSNVVNLFQQAYSWMKPGSEPSRYSNPMLLLGGLLVYHYQI